MEQCCAEPRHDQAGTLADINMTVLGTSEADEMRKVIKWDSRHKKGAREDALHECQTHCTNNNVTSQ